MPVTDLNSNSILRANVLTRSSHRSSIHGYPKETFWKNKDQGKVGVKKSLLMGARDLENIDKEVHGSSFSVKVYRIGEYSVNQRDRLSDFISDYNALSTKKEVSYCQGVKIDYKKTVLKVKRYLKNNSLFLYRERKRVTLFYLKRKE